MQEVVEEREMDTIMNATAALEERHEQRAQSRINKLS